MRTGPITPIYSTLASVHCAWRTKTSIVLVHRAGELDKVVTLTSMVLTVGPNGQRDAGVLWCADFSLAMALTRLR